MSAGLYILSPYSFAIFGANGNWVVKILLLHPKLAPFARIVVQMKQQAFIYIIFRK